MIMPRKSPSNEDDQVAKAEPKNKQHRLGRNRLPLPKRPQRFSHLPNSKIPQQAREKNHSEVDGDQMFKNIGDGCFGLGIANRKRKGPKISVMQVSLALVIPSQSRNHHDKSNDNSASCCRNTCTRVSAGNEPAVSETRHDDYEVHGRSLPNQCCHPDQGATEKHQSPHWLLLPLQECKNTR